MFQAFTLDTVRIRQTIKSITTIYAKIFFGPVLNL